MTPLEVVAAPYEVWVAPVATAFPKVDAVPAGTWTKLGTSGNKNYTEDGVTVEHDQTLVQWRAAGAAAPRKAFRTQENLLVRLMLADMSVAQYAKVINDATVTVTAPGPTQAGESSFPLAYGLTVATFALLCRGMSPAGVAFTAQYEVPIVYNAGQPKPKFNKGVPVELECIFTALLDDTAGMGTLRIQTAVHT